MIKKYTLLLIVIISAVASSFGQIATIDFETNLTGYSHTPSQLPSADPGDQYFHRAVPSDSDIYEGSFGPYTNVTGSWLFVGSNPKAINSSNPGILDLDPINVSAYTNLELSMDWGAGTVDWDASDGITVEYRYDGTGSWATLYSLSVASGATFNAPLELTGNSTGGVNTANGLVLIYALQTITSNNFTGTMGTNINIRIVCDSNANYEAFGLDNIVLNGTPTTPTPTITVDTPSITGLDYIFPGGPSVPQSYLLSAVNLTPAAGNLTVTAPTNFSISTASGGPFTPVLVIPYAGGTLAATNIWVQLNAGLAIGTYGPSNITNAGGGATTQNVSVIGNVTAGGSGASDILSVPGSESPLISSLNNDPSPLNSTQGAPVWQFRVRDGGATNDADILPTILTSFNITQYTGNQVTTWSDAIQSVDLFDGATHIATGVITASQIQFSGLNVSVADDTEKILSLRLSLQCPLGADAFDGEDFVFGITNANVNFSGAGSGKSSFPTQFSANGQNVINVLATELQFTTQPINTGFNSTMTDVVVTATDVCGNINTTFNGAISLTSTGTMTGDPISVNAVNGVATFTNIIVHTALGTGLTLTATSSAFGISSVVSDPFDITPVTVLDRGDLAIIAVNTNVNQGAPSGAGRDQIALVIFKTITAGTRIYLTDNGYERTYAGEWGGTEGVISITRTGPDLVAGTIIVIEATNANVTSSSHYDVYTCGVIDTNWTKTAVSGTNVGGFNLNSNDDVWIMQGGIWNNDTDQHSTYTGGNVLYGWTESGWHTTPGGPSDGACSGSGSNGCTRWSTIYPGLECFNTVAPTGDGFVKFNDPINPDFSTATNARLDWIALINTTSNWDNYANSTAYIAGGYDYKGNTTCPALTIAASTYVDGKWTGNADINWFNCSNWDTLVVPDETIDVIVTSSSSTYAEIDANAPFAANFGRIAKAHNLTITGQKVEIINSTLSNVLEVHGDLLIDNPAGQLDMTNANSDDKIVLYGDWRNLVGVSAFIEGNGTVEFKGTTDQIITGGIPDPLIPEEFYNVILDNDYNTSISNNLYMNGSLTIIGGRTLTVTDANYVYVNLGVANNGTFYIENNGSLVQDNDSGINTGTDYWMDRDASIRREDYVYWSSPLAGFTVNNISLGTPSALIFRWNPTIANPEGSQGNWVSANGATMLAGQGFIVRGPSSYTDSVQNYKAIFSGGAPFNGVKPITVYRGSILGDDDNWNLIGNPYPSAIDAYTFLNDPANAELDGFVYLWTHGTLPNTSAGDPFYDDFYSNYDAADYVAYNGLGMGSGIGDVPIGAGQSFMVNVSETAGNFGANSYPIEFNNNMRGIGANYDNSQFYRPAIKSTLDRTTIIEEKHRIWLDLVSDTQRTNRILVGYAENATMARDRMYDAITDVQGNQGFYSMIDNLGFAIQGRALPFDETDVIPLGMQLIENGGYHIAIGAIDGLFDTENQTIYLKDNALGFIHNLTESPYSFSADAGVINDRFEIIFTTQSLLSVDEQQELTNGLTIVELQNGSVKFTVSNGLEIKNVKIYDTLGRLLYNLEGNNSTEIYNFSNLSQATYIAKVTLSNDSVVTKKAVKRN